MSHFCKTKCTKIIPQDHSLRQPARNFLTFSVTGFVHQARVLCQLCVDFHHLTSEWWEKLASGLHTFQGTKLLWNTNTQAAKMWHCKTQCWSYTVPAAYGWFLPICSSLWPTSGSPQYTTSPNASYKYMRRRVNDILSFGTKYKWIQMINHNDTSTLRCLR